jgi:glycosyltransferase involved in cell wall biosynthesis
MTDVATPDVTVVIPTFRRPRFLARAILSALEQGPRVRVAVFDNCSGDETASVVQRIGEGDPRVDYHCHAENIGALANFDFALRSVRTPYFSILSDDDYLLPGFHAAALSALAAVPDAMFWAGITLHVDEDGMVWDARVDRWPREGLYLPPEGALAMTGGRAPTWTGVLFRRELLDVSGYPDPEARGPADLDFMIRLAARHPFLLAKYPAAVFTLNRASFSATQPLSSFWPGWQRMIGNVNAMQDAGTGRLVEALTRDALRMLFRRGINAIAARRFDFARDAAEVLDRHFRRRMQGRLLRAMAVVCERVPGARAVFSGAYRMAERAVVRSRAPQLARYSRFVRNV